MRLLQKKKKKKKKISILSTQRFLAPGAGSTPSETRIEGGFFFFLFLRRIADDATASAMRSLPVGEDLRTSQATAVGARRVRAASAPPGSPPSLAVSDRGEGPPPDASSCPASSWEICV
jgi:hypothetical protein